MPDNLSKNILATLVYYDVMGYPMTVFEVWKYLIQVANGDRNANEKSLASDEFSLENVNSYLAENPKLGKYIDSFRGFYFLKGRKELVEKRLARNKISEEKFKVILPVVRIIRWFPFVRMIAIAGRLATKSAEKNSDLDLLIGIKHGKIFTGRFLVTLVVHLLGRRRYADKIKDRICLNHFITTKFAISAQDIFSSHEYVFLRPVYDNDFLMNFYENNKWIRKYRPNFSPVSGSTFAITDSKLSRVIRKIGEKALQFDWIENRLSDWQRKKIQRNPKSRQKGGLIVCSPEELAFWPNFEKQGPAVFEKFQARLREISEQ